LAASLQLQHARNRHVIVHFFPTPPAGTGFGGDVESGTGISGGQRNDVSAETYWRRIRQVLTLWIGESDLPMGICMHRKAFFMHHPVMAPAQQCQIIQTGYAPICPVVDVVRINEPAAGTAWKPATVVPAL